MTTDNESTETNPHLDMEFDDYVSCNNCEFLGLVRLGSDACPKCGEGCLVDKEKPWQEMAATDARRRITGEKE